MDLYSFFPHCKLHAYVGYTDYISETSGKSPEQLRIYENVGSRVNNLLISDEQVEQMD